LPPTPPAGGFSIWVSGPSVSGTGATKNTNSPTLTLNLDGDSNAARMAISNSPDFVGASQQTYSTTASWNICQGLATCTGGLHTIYAIFYTQYGQPSNVVQVSVNYIAPANQITQPPQTSPSTPSTPSAQCTPYLLKYIKLGAANDPVEVKKLQTFLRDYEGFSDITVSGVYDKVTYNDVVKFQERYAADILTPYGISKGTGYVYKTTLKKINQLYCANQQPVVQAPMCSPYLLKYIKLGAANDPAEVKKLKSFLTTYEGFTNLDSSGVYDQAAYNDVVQFQEKYAADILTPWGRTTGTGYVYQTTLKKINQLYCSYTSQ